MSLIENLNWRHAVKAFDPSKKVSEEKVEKIIEAASRCFLYNTN